MSKRNWVLLGLDTFVVLLFAGLGRSTHHDGFSVVGLLGTAWPFLVGLIASWGVLLAVRWRWDPVSLVGFWLTWLGTLCLGMLLRQATGNGTAVAFVVVATVFLAVCFALTRLIVRLFGRQGRRERPLVGAETEV